MMLSLIRRDAALRALPIWAVVLLLNASVLLGVLVAVAARRHAPVPEAWLTALGWAALSPVLLLGPARTRCGRLDLGLPIPGRRLWLAHCAATAIIVVVLMAAYAGGLALVRRALGSAVALDADLPSLALLLAAGGLLALVLVQAPRPSLARLPFSTGVAVWSIAVLVALLALLPAAAALGPGAAALLVLAAAAAAVWMLRSIPATLVAAPREPDPAPGAATGASDTSAAAAYTAAGAGSDAGPGATRRRAALAVLSCLHSGAKEWIAVPFIVLFGLMIGNGLTAVLDDPAMRDMRFLYLPMAVYMMFALFVPRLTRLQHLDPLPIGRRVLFAGLALPGLVAFVASFAAGHLAETRGAQAHPMVDYRKSDDGWRVTVPLRVYRMAWDGSVPEIAAPWGESHPADRAALLRGATPAVYSPYSAPPGSTARFVALQISRAARDVYGVTIQPEEIERRYLTTGVDGSAAGLGESLTMETDFHGLRPRSGPVSALLLLLVIAPYMALVAVLFRAHRSSIREWVRQSIVWGALGCAMLVFFALMAAVITHRSEPWVLRALIEIPAFALGRTAAGTVATWLAAALTAAGAYRLAERQFERMEIPVRPSKFTLIGGLCAPD